MRYFCLASILIPAVLPVALAHGAAITADTVVGYAPGNASATFQNSTAAVGALTGDTTYGGMNPFNPPFDPSQIVIVGAGGNLTLHLSAPVATSGRTLGVFVNNGLVDISADGSGQASTPAITFSDFPQAIVSVSADGSTYVPLNGGSPITFTNPSNYFLDSPIVNYFQNLGNVVADESKPFLGDITSFDGKNFQQILTVLDGSAGGNWLDLSGTALASVSDVRFTVPAGASYRMVVDGVAGVAANPVPEPASLACLGLGGLLLLARKRR